MFKKGSFVAMIFALLFMVASLASSGQEENVTGDVMVFKNDLWLHWFSFEAREMGNEPLGTGFITHQRLNDDGTEISREEHIQILYVIIDGNEAWFAGPIVYDSLDPDPTRWFVVYVQDNDQRGDDNDLIWFNRVADQNEAQNLLGSYSWGKSPPDDLESGNIKVHSKPKGLSIILMLLLQ